MTYSETTPKDRGGAAGRPTGQRLDCAAAQALRGREAGGADLDAHERAALVTHLHFCAPCQADWALDEALALRDAADTGPALPLSHVGEARFVDAVLSAAREPSLRTIPFPARPRRRFGWAFGGIALVATAALFAVFVLPRLAPPTDPGTLVSSNGGAIARSLVGAVRADGELVARGADLAPGALVTTGPAGRVALAFADGTVLHVGPESRFELPNGDRADRVVRLGQGRLLATVSKQAPGHSFVIATPHGRVEVVGTAFTVDVGDEAEDVRVLEGVVRVHDAEAAGKPRMVRAHQATRIDVPDDEVRTLDHAAAREDVALILDDPQRAAALAEDVADGEPVARRSKRAPRKRAVNATAHTDPPAADRLAPGAAEPERAGTGPAATEGVPVAAEPTNRWLHEARDRRAARDWAGAAAAYRALFDETPRSADARAARVSYGELLLEKLGDPRGALGAFDAYLRATPNGALAEEAQWGRARSLRALGDATAERASLEALIERYPTSAFARRARARLDSLDASP